MKFSFDRGVKPQHLKTKLVYFSLKNGSPKYRQLADERREAAGIEVMQMSGEGRNDYAGPTREVTINTEFVFGNQWNTEPDEHSSNGLRVFNWYESYEAFRIGVRAGHYLEITGEMRNLCIHTHRCGYCGAQYYGLEHAGCFCSACLDSEYLEEKNLYLLRLMPVALNSSEDPDRRRWPLTEHELGPMLVAYAARQTAADGQAGKKAIKQRNAIEDEYIKEVQQAKVKHDGLIWLLNHDMPVDNVIYYDHIGRFSFGWRTPIGPAVLEMLQPILADFPFPYDIVTTKE